MCMGFSLGFLSCSIGLYFFFSASNVLSLEKAMALHSSILAWKVPQAEEPGGLQEKLDTTEQLSVQ